MTRGGAGVALLSAFMSVRAACFSASFLVTALAPLTCKSPPSSTDTPVGSSADARASRGAPAQKRSTKRAIRDGRRGCGRETRCTSPSAAPLPPRRTGRRRRDEERVRRCGSIVTRRRHLAAGTSVLGHGLRRLRHPLEFRLPGGL